MAFTTSEGKMYKTIFLDTNAISEIVKNSKGVGVEFFSRFPPDKYALCFSTYNIFEILKTRRRHLVEETTFDKFCKFFSVYPFLMTWPYKIIIQKEFRGELSDCNEIYFGAFTYLGESANSNLNEFLVMLESDTELKEIISNETSKEPEVKEAWENQRPNKGRGSFIHYSRRLEEGNVLKTLSDPWYELDIDTRFADFRKYPGVRLMLFSQFMRVHHTNKPIGINDINDVMISCVIPYVDIVITEKYQAELYKQAKGRIKELKQLELVKISDLYSSKSID